MTFALSRGALMTEGGKRRSGSQPHNRKGQRSLYGRCMNSPEDRCKCDKAVYRARLDVLSMFSSLSIVERARNWLVPPTMVGSSGQSDLS